MEILTIEEVSNGAGAASRELRQKVVELLGKKSQNKVLNLAYTDYGGTILDKVLIKYYKTHYPKRTWAEDAPFFGENAFVYITPREEAELKKYPFPDEEARAIFEEIDMEYFLEAIEDVIDELYEINRTTMITYEFDEEEVKEWLMENKFGYYPIYPWGIDINFAKLELELLCAGVIKKVKKVNLIRKNAR